MPDLLAALTPTAIRLLDAALEALDSVADAEVTGAPGAWTLTIAADAGHPLQVIDAAFDGNLQLDCIGA